MGAMKNLSRTLVWCAAGLLLAGSAQATPLGLQNGDIVDSIEWDSLLDGSDGPGGDGGSFTSTGDDTGDSTMDGRITSVTIRGNPVANTLSDTNFMLKASMSGLTIIPLGGTFIAVSVDFDGVAGDDITLSDGTGTILTAELDSGFTIGGVYDTEAMTNVATANAVNISVSGGDPTLVAALGDIGGGATLNFDGTLFDFLPTLEDILYDQIINESYVFSGSGNIQPTAPVPFVPEPGTLVLMGLGLLGLSLTGSRSRR